MRVKRRLPALLVVAGLVGLIVLGPAQPAPSKRADDPSVPAACKVATVWRVKGNWGMVTGTNFLGTRDGQPLVVRTNMVERMRIDPGGNVGIGTARPTSNVDVNIGAAATANAGITIQGNTSSYGDLGLKLINLGPGGTEWFLDSTNQNSGWGAGKLSLVTGPGEALPVMTLTSDSRVGIGTTNPQASLDVQASGGSSTPLQVTDPADPAKSLFSVSNTGTTSVSGSLGVGGGLSVGSSLLVGGTLYVGSFGPLAHVCKSPSGELADCSCAAEYVPTVDTGRGFPGTGDLVSIASELASPYGDHHSPFAVAKSSRPCDPNLLGFLLNPASGAEGKTLNSHYLPLDIYGYFPAKVTMQGGMIHRGDPITSSSTPGYGMRATGACRIVGYALQDATTTGDDPGLRRTR